MLALLPIWLDTLHEIEALSSLANFAYLNPDYSYPEATATSAGSADPRINGIAQTGFKAEGLGHPLIPAGKRIHNNFSFDEHSRIALITGSNMAGKSSFLRTLGLFRVFACIRINDSLTDGFSLFYAEVKRLKMLLSAVESDSSFPVLFLIDEIFRGTNNIERFIGSREFVRALAKLPTIGAVATHDLELAKLAEENEAISNYHFREEVKNGQMIFDYTLRSGPCPTTNALKIMSMAGLPVNGQ
jgi:DNA mismatch repair ATPase MutS